MARGGKARQAEDYVVARIRSRPGWNAHNANDYRLNQPGFDVLAIDVAGRQVRVSVKSVSSGEARHDYAIGRSFKKYPSDIYAFVDTTVETPWLVYLAGAETVKDLATERHFKYQSDRGRTAAMNTWAPKISQALLEAMDAREAWDVLNDPASATSSQTTDELRRQARADAPRPRGKWQG